MILLMILTLHSAKMFRSHVFPGMGTLLEASVTKLTRKWSDIEVAIVHVPAQPIGEVERLSAARVCARVRRGVNGVPRLHVLAEVRAFREQFITQATRVLLNFLVYSKDMLAQSGCFTEGSMANGAGQGCFSGAALLEGRGNCAETPVL
jgi:hypothetical protein